MSYPDDAASQNTSAPALDSQAFLQHSLQAGVLRFGSFRTKAGRDSPYFFNAGLFNSGAALARLGEFYAHRLLASGVAFDMLFGPAYKGIPLAATTAIALARRGRDVPYAYNRKEAKDHGEGGTLVGAPLAGRVVIIDDVISAGISVDESVQIIRAAGATPAAVLIALDRQERAHTSSTPQAAQPNSPATASVENGASAAQQVTQRHGMPVLSVADLAGMLAFLRSSGDPSLEQYHSAIEHYRSRYGMLNSSI